jgi:hypothetical protein
MEFYFSRSKLSDISKLLRGKEIVSKVLGILNIREKDCHGIPHS